MYDIIIVGAGPSGLTAAMYAKRASKNVLVLEAKSYGGQIINAAVVENYPCEEKMTGYDFATKLYNQIKNMNIEIKYEKVIEIESTESEKIVKTKDNVYKTKTIILATGSDNRKLGLENEDEFLGKGISYCATCDGSFFKDKVVAVVGGGNTALEDANYLSDIAKKVFVIHRNDNFKGEKILSDKLISKENVEVIFNSEISSINGNGKLESIDVIDKESNKINIVIDGLFIAIGRVPENQNFSKIINLDDSGYIIADETCKTNIPGIYASGDSRTKSVRQLVTATSDGAVSALEAIKYINN